MQGYGGDIDSLVMLVYPDASEQYVQELGVSNFIDGVRDIQVQQAQILRDFAEMKDVMVYALMYEVATPVSRLVTSIQ